VAKLYYTSIDLNGQEIRNAALQQLGSAPGSPGIGRIYFDTTLGKARIYDGTDWINVGEGAITNVLGSGAISVSVTDGVATVSIAAATASVPGTMSAADKSKLDGVEAGATADQTGAEIKTAYEAEADTNAFTDALKTKLDGVETGATADQTAAEIKTAYESNTDTNAFTDAQQTKLAGIETGATADQSAAEVPFTSGSGVVATNVGAAIDEVKDLADTKAPTGHAHTASDVTDFHTAVRTNRLDQMAAPTASVAMGSQKLTGLASGTDPGDAVTKAQLDVAAQGTIGLDPVRAATTAGDGNQALSGTPTIDGVTLAASDRVLIKDQTDASQNGVYVVAAGAWSRALDADEPNELKTGNYVFVEEGTTNSNSTFAINTQGAITVGTTDITWTILSKPGEVTAGAGLTKTGNTLDVVGGTGITVAADEITIDTTVVARKVTATIGDGAATSFTITHNFGTRDVAVAIRQSAAPYAEVEADVEMATVNTVTVRFATAPTAGQFAVIVIG
jgi:hypothetical protein